MCNALSDFDWHRRDWLYLALVIAISIAGNAVLLRCMPFETSDEGYHYYIAGRLAAGDSLFHDLNVDSYLPGAFLPWVVSFKLFGSSVLVGRLVIAIGLTWGAAWAYVAARSTMRAPFALMAAIAIAILPGPPYKFYLRGLMLPLLACAMLRLRTGRREALAALAGFTGAAWTIRMDAFYVGTALLLGLAIVERARQWPWHWIAPLYFGPSAIVAAALVPTGGASAYLEKTLSVLRIAGVRVRSTLNVAPPSPGNTFALDRHGIDAGLYYGGLAIVLSLTIYVATLAWRQRSIFAPEVVGAGIVTGWTALHLPQYLAARPDTYHLVQQYFALALGAVWLSSQLWGRRWTTSLALLLLLWVAWIPTGRFAIGGRWSAGVVQRNAQDRVDSRGQWYPELPLDETSAVLELVNTAVPEGQELVVVPFQPGIAFLAHRELATAESYTLPIVREDPVRLDTLHRDLRASEAPLVLYAESFSSNGKSSGLMQSYLPKVHGHLLEHYQRLWSLSPQTVLFPRSNTPVTLDRPSAVAEIDGLLTRRNYRRARVALLNGLIGQPNSPWFQSQLARLAFETGDAVVFEEATTRALKLIDAAGPSPSMRFLRSRNVFRVALTARHERKPDRALQLFESTVRLDPKWGLARLELARSLAHHTLRDRAIEEAQRAFALDPGLDEALEFARQLSTAKPSPDASP